MARSQAVQGQHELFESLRELLLRFAEVPDHLPCDDPRCIYCKEVEGRRVFVLLKSLGNYLRQAEGHS